AHTALYFEGVYMDSTLYVNGTEAGQWKYGYSSFEHEVTPFLKPGNNEVVLKVVHQSPNSRWYSGAGIYRDVYLISRGNRYIPTHGIYLAVRQKEGEWIIEIETELIQELAQEGNLRLEHHLLYHGALLATARREILPSMDRDIQHLRVRNPLLWSPETPHLYTLETFLFDKEGHLIEKHHNPVGFRTLTFDPQRGFFVNGVPYKLQGTCEHHDLGALGAAFNREAMRHRLTLLKAMGVNAIRTAHNMPAPALMDLADEMGFFILSEAFDMWERPKTSYDYARFFPQWYAQDVASWIRRDRNHPSLLMWSIGNEIYDTHADQRGQEITWLLLQEVRRHDPKGNAPVTIGSNFMPWENAQKCADILTYAGYNYAKKYYQEHHNRYPHWIIYGSETASVVQSRGVYHFPYECTILAEVDQQCSALGNSPTSWGARSYEACIAADRDTTFSLGMFIWSGFDYIGEPTPYHTKNSYFGQLDTATFPKDSYYIYQAAWTDYKRAPMIHIFPYWDWNPGQLIDVRVCSNAPRIALYCNGRLIGTKDIDHHHGSNQVGTWKIPYEPGELVALAYDEKGHCIARAVRRSFGDPARIILSPSKSYLEADGRDIIFVTISMEDAAGNPVENATNRVTVAISGAGRLIGLDNGDSTDYDSYKGTSRRLFNGKLMALIGATKETGPLTIKVSSPGLEVATCTLTAVPSGKQDLCNYDVIARNSPRPIVTGTADEIPQRKIELLLVNGSQHLSPDIPTAILEAHVYPLHTSYKDLFWSVVTASGIETPLAQIEPQGNRAIVRPRGDGEFRVRCMSTNGTDTVRLISQLEFTARGFGNLHKDPYHFISAGLYDDSNGDLGPGNEQGIATARDSMTIVGYKDIDFGTHGSDTITLPIFTLNDEAYHLEVWDGHPEKPGSTVVGKLVYQKKSIWNVYQEETYRLKRRLRGLQSLYFVTTAKMHIKGFVFEKQNRTFTTISALEYDELYGDSFRLTNEGIEEIGNNVTITFRDLFFEGTLPQSITLYGRSRTDKNSIHLRWSDGKETMVQLVDFTQQEFGEQTVPLLELPMSFRNIPVSLSFVFLPGSSFDFGWFRFNR
ncbi:MAG: DUF4982 domain-containing protein, partial [Treponemataceae bacterium]|nr:DUF4982 domain-containing protein [Treponemataceae bacterium]